MTARALKLLLAAACLTLLTAADNPERRSVEGQLQETEQSLLQATAERQAKLRQLTATQTELLALSNDLQAAVSELREHEKSIAAISASLKDLEAQRDGRQAELEWRREQAGSVVAALVRLTALPPEAAFVGPGSSVDRLRTALLMRGLGPRLEERATALTAEIATIREAEKKIAVEQAELREAKVELERRYRSLSKVVDQKNQILATQTSAADRTAAITSRLAKSAGNLREFLARIDAERDARMAAVHAERQRRATLALSRGFVGPVTAPPPIQLVGLQGREGRLIAPVNGHLLYPFGEGEGRFTEGVTLGAAPDTPVLSPADGRVVYAGPFRDYGILLIIEHGGGFHSVLTGLGDSEKVAGEWVLAGEPLGLTAGHGSLYIEIRENGLPVDPLAWFTVDRS